MADEDEDGGEVEGDGGMEMAADVMVADKDGGDVGCEMVTSVVGGDSNGGHRDGGVVVMWLTR
nr:hypothetical protein [Tanacetum cinerariifolium]